MSRLPRSHRVRYALEDDRKGKQRRTIHRLVKIVRQTSRLMCRLRVVENAEREETKAEQRQTKPKSGTQEEECALCAPSQHHIKDCPPFTRLSAEGRRTVAEKYRLCYRCLRRGHRTPTCPSKTYCGECGGTHATQLHGAFTAGGKGDRDQGARRPFAAGPGADLGGAANPPGQRRRYDYDRSSSSSRREPQQYDQDRRPYQQWRANARDDTRQWPNNNGQAPRQWPRNASKVETQRSEQGTAAQVATANNAHVTAKCETADHAAGTGSEGKP